MTFAQEFLKLLEKYTNKIESVKSLVVTEAFGVPIEQPDSVATLIYSLNSIRDYHDTDTVSVYDEELGAEMYFYDLGYNLLTSDWEKDLNKSFENYLKEQAEEDLSLSAYVEVLKTPNSLSLLLSGFYMSLVETVICDLHEEYSKLKNKYPKESFYPLAYVSTHDLTHYESSRCW